MPSQREIRRRIGSAKNIKQITRAMQFVAASKLRRAQESTLAARPYREKLDEVMFTDKELASTLLWTFVRTLSARLRETNDKIRAFFALSSFGPR